MVTQSFSGPLGLAAHSAPARHDAVVPPAPAETETGNQQDDNVDDLGRRSDGKQIDQPVDPGQDADEKG